MPTQPQPPSAHYQAAERLLAVAEGSVVDTIQSNAALIAVAHAILTLSPRKARRVARPAQHASNGLPPHLSWDDES
jgi:hypothetical protein